ncbi:MAG: cytochrome oxidase subunit III [Aureispira sp.]|nr:cytochrome oxidase subunit III [Aureispira sp.]
MSYKNIYLIVKNNYYNDQQEKPFFNVAGSKVFLYLLLLSLSFLFVAFAVGYVFTRAQNSADGIYLPPIFILNSILLLGTSFTMSKANKAYKSDNTVAYQRALWGTLVLTLVFMGAQVVAWTSFREQLIGENIGNGAHYLYAISGLHFAHILGGIPFLILFIYTAHIRMKEPVSVLVYFSDVTKRLKLELLTTYWHFLDGLWLFLVAFFLFNMML